jgi:hypothetical protein
MEQMHCHDRIDGLCVKSKKGREEKKRDGGTYKKKRIEGGVSFYSSCCSITVQL